MGDESIEVVEHIELVVGDRFDQRFGGDIGLDRALQGHETEGAGGKKQ
ncbi:hypothetical protein [Chromohalobacter israelensis]|nr:hypothetical protein [Chromohalobacter salexigens]